MSTEMIAVRLTSEQKERLEQLASQRKQTVSDVIRSWIDGNDSGMNGIPSELREQIRTEAERRKQSEGYIIERAIRYALDNLRSGVLWQW